jgi:hypothetical protein
VSHSPLFYRARLWPQPPNRVRRYLPVYALYRKRWEQFVQYCVGLALYAAAGYIGWQINATATTCVVPTAHARNTGDGFGTSCCCTHTLPVRYVLIVPFFMASFFLMLGNFSQVRPAPLVPR